MKSQLLSDGDSQRTYAIVFDTGDEVIRGLLAFAREHGISAASFTGIGAFERATLGYFEVDRRDYRKIPVDEQVEVLSLAGNVALASNEPRIHAHVVAGRADGTACGGHLLEAHVRPTLEVVLVEPPARLRRTTDPATGLPLLNLT
jgi:uncharacterized protein